MASCSGLLSEEQFQCSICLDVFTEPVSIACGHNFCKACLGGYWDNSDSCLCPLCKQVFTRRPELKTNTTIRELTDQFKGMMRDQSAAAKRGDNEVACDICTWRKLSAAKFCLQCLTYFCKVHLEPHRRVAGLKRHTLIDPAEKLEDRMCQEHHVLLDWFCRTDQKCVCHLCLEKDHHTHNAILLEMECGERQAELRKIHFKVQQMIQERQQKVQDIKYSVELCKNDTERDIADSMQVFSALIASAERSQSELLWAIEKKQKAVERKAEGFMKVLKLEIRALRQRGDELAQLSQNDDPFHVLQNSRSLYGLPHVNDWPEFSARSNLCEDEENIRKSLRSAVGELEATGRRELSDLEDKLNKEMEKFPDQKLRWIQQFAMDVTLDPDTAHRSLTLSDNRKEVREGKWQKRPFNQKRFTGFLGASVVATKGYSSGKFYYEVQVEGKKKWALGVVRESIDRRKSFSISPEHGYWTIEMGDGYKASTDPPVLLFPRKLRKVGVFVDYKRGQVSFYDVDSKSHIYSFIGYTFTGALYPYFHCGVDDSAPLVITPVGAAIAEWLVSPPREPEALVAPGTIPGHASICVDEMKFVPEQDS